MIYHQVYSELYRAVARVLLNVLSSKKRCESTLNVALETSSQNKDIRKIVKQLFHGEDLDSEQGEKRVRQEGFLLSRQGDAPVLKAVGSQRDVLLDKVPEQILTTLEWRWLKTIMSDPRIKLFDIDIEIPEDIEPLYNPEDIYYFDCPESSDPWTEQAYIDRFKVINAALENVENLEIIWQDRRHNRCRAVCRPDHLEYDMSEDKMRLWASTDSRLFLVNLNRIQSCAVSDAPMCIDFGDLEEAQLPSADYLNIQKQARENAKTQEDVSDTALLCIIITDIDGGLERALSHFAHYQKRDFRRMAELGDNIYCLEICFDPRHDSYDIVQKVLYSGRAVKVTSPDFIIDEIRARIHRQQAQWELRIRD
ncbi:MAG: hypothetical protein II180_03805 [Proteobacteria bacterium]|nr:hypothetical protein [Pseudomonadota bacterium]